MKPYSRLAWTNEEGGEGGPVTTVTFEEKGGKTLVVLHESYPSNEALVKPFTVKPGELHLYGIFKYTKVSDPGIGRAGKFSLTPASKPTHAEVLRKILEQSSLSPKWRKRVQARLKELGG